MGKIAHQVFTISKSPPILGSMLLEKSLLRNKLLTLLPVCSLLLGIADIFAGQVGGLSGAYLRPAVGATALAMGGASAAAPDYLAPWWNPAVLANLRENKFSFGAGTRSMGRTDLYSEFDLRVPPRLGLGFLALYRGDPFLNNLYNDDYDNPEKLPDASYTTVTGKISIGYYLSRKLSAGASIGIHYQQLPTSTNDNGKWIYSSATGIGAFDIAASYKHNDHLTLALVVRDLFALMNWELDDGAYSPTIEDRPIPSFTIASKYCDSLRHKPFIWTTDLKGYLVDGEWNSLSRPEAYLSSGVEWQYWKSFYLRFGLGDILLNGDITSNTEDYFSEFPCKITAGFSVEFSKFRKGMFVNYGMATDKTWAGIDQQLDLTLSF
jgi:hypothetical protein